MGCVGSFFKKVWNGIKSVAHALWTGIKTVTKAIVKAVGYIGGILVEAATTVLLVAATVITAVLSKFPLMIFFGSLTLLSIIFLSNMIIFGRDNDNHHKEDNKKIESQFNLNGNNIGNKPNFENEPNKKNYNLMSKFLNNVDIYIDKVKNNQKDSLRYLYSFTLGENDEVEAELENSFNHKQYPSNVLVSSCNFECSEYNNKNIIKIELENEGDIENGKKILKIIKKALYIKFNYNFDFYEEEDDIKKVDIKEIDNIETILMKAII